jgi:hypothetical protein
VSRLVSWVGTVAVIFIGGSCFCPSPFVFLSCSASVPFHRCSMVCPWPASVPLVFLRQHLYRFLCSLVPSLFLRLNPVPFVVTLPPSLFLRQHFFALCFFGNNTPYFSVALYLFVPLATARLTSLLLWQQSYFSVPYTTTRLTFLFLWQQQVLLLLSFGNSTSYSSVPLATTRLTSLFLWQQHVSPETTCVPALNSPMLNQPITPASVHLGTVYVMVLLIMDMMSRYS